MALGFVLGAAALGMVECSTVERQGSGKEELRRELASSVDLRLPPTRPHSLLSNTMDAFASQLAQLQQQIPELVSAVARLSAENRAHKGELTALASSLSRVATENARLTRNNARLSSDISGLRSLVDDHELLIGALETTSYPKGRFIFSFASGETGAWWFSLVRTTPSPGSFPFLRLPSSHS